MKFDSIILNDTNISCQHLYFTSPSVTDDLKYSVLICQDIYGPNIYIVDNNDKSLKKISNSKGLLQTYTYPNGNIENGLSKTSPFLDSKRRIIYWIQDHNVYSYSIALDQKPKKIAKLPNKWIGGYTTLSSCGNFLAVPYTPTNAFKTSYRNQHDQLLDVPKRFKKLKIFSHIYIINLQNGAVELFSKVPFWVTHLNFTINNEEIIANSEGHFNFFMINSKYYWKRLWIITRSRGFFALKNQRKSDRLNHENLSNDKSLLVYHGIRWDVKYIFHRILYSLFIRLRYHNLAHLFNKSKEFICIRDYNKNQMNYIFLNIKIKHAICGLKNIVIDSSDFNIYLYVLDQKKLSIVGKHNSNYNIQDTHPHPVLFNQDNTIIYTDIHTKQLKVYNIFLDYEVLNSLGLEI